MCPGSQNEYLWNGRKGLLCLSVFYEGERGLLCLSVYGGWEGVFVSLFIKGQKGVLGEMGVASLSNSRSKERPCSIFHFDPPCGKEHRTTPTFDRAWSCSPTIFLSLISTVRTKMDDKTWSSLTEVGNFPVHLIQILGISSNIFGYNEQADIRKKNSLRLHVPLIFEIYCYVITQPKEPHYNASSLESLIFQDPEILRSTVLNPTIARCLGFVILGFDCTVYWMIGMFSGVQSRRTRLYNALSSLCHNTVGWWNIFGYVRMYARRKIRYLWEMSVFVEGINICG